jgi:ribosomal protein S18 acetylase RimI-like enzyme
MTISIIRITSVSDIQIQLFKEVFPDNNWDLQHSQEFVESKQNYLLIAEEVGKPCGFLTAYTLPRLDKQYPELFLYEIEINKAYRKKGIGNCYC